ncbi:MAG: dipeptide ABC transporter ATP-binding protein [Aliidongia sp.]
MSAKTPLMSVRDLRVHFPLPSGLFAETRMVKAVDGVSFDLYAGETLGIVGESGCGKSTLGRAVLRLIPPTAGTVVWLGQDLKAADKRQMRALRQDMQIIFQDPLAALDPRMTVGAIIAEPLDTFEPNLPKTEREARVAETMQRVGLSPALINRYAHEFSGGQCQRIGIARAMILKPKLVVCDEPVSALDVSIQAQIVNLLRKLQREENLALIFISHNLAVVRLISSRVMVLYLGKVAELADRDEIYRNPRHPYTQALLSAVPVPDPDFERSKKRISLTGDLPSPINPPSGCVFRTRCPIAIDRCATQAPQLEAVTDSHTVSCHRWREAIQLLEPAIATVTTAAS